MAGNNIIMKEEFYELLSNILDDIRYTVKHGTYSINDGKLEKNVNTNNILINVGTYIKYVTSNITIYKDAECIIDYVALYDAFRRYSRDIWGYKRIYSLISKMPEISGAVSKSYVLEELESSGLKVVSLNPYIDRQCAYLLYWLCKTRPFRLNFSKADENQFNEAYTSYNEMVSFMFIVHILQVKGCKISIKKEAFNDIIRDIHYRVLGRTSLELLLTALVSKK